MPENVLPKKKGGGGVVGSFTMVYREGGVTKDNVYGTQAELMVAFAKTEGPVVIAFDNSITSPMSLVTADFEGRTEFTPYLVTTPGALELLVDVADGETVSGFSIRGDMGLRFHNTAAPAATFPQGMLSLRDGGTILKTGPYAVVDLGENEALATEFANGGGYISNSGPLVNMLAATASVSMVAMDAPVLHGPIAGIIQGIEGSSFALTRDASVDSAVSMAPDAGIAKTDTLVDKAENSFYNDNLVEPQLGTDTEQGAFDALKTMITVASAPGIEGQVLVSRTQSTFVSQSGQGLASTCWDGEARWVLEPDNGAGQVLLHRVAGSGGPAPRVTDSIDLTAYIGGTIQSPGAGCANCVTSDATNIYVSYGQHNAGSSSVIVIIDKVTKTVVGVADGVGDGLIVCGGIVTTGGQLIAVCKSGGTTEVISLDIATIIAAFPATAAFTDGSPVVIDTYAPGGGSNPYGSSTDGLSVWIVEYDDVALYRIWLDGSPGATQPILGAQPFVTHVLGGSVYVTTDVVASVIRFDIASFPAAAIATTPIDPAAISFQMADDGAFLWITPYTSNGLVWRYDPTDDSFIQVASEPGDSNAYLVFDGEAMWSTILLGVTAPALLGMRKFEVATPTYEGQFNGNTENVYESLPVPTFANKHMTAENAAVDGSLACLIPIAYTPRGYIQVLAGGGGQWLGGLLADCYFSRDGGVTAVALTDVRAGDFLYWNPTIAGFALTNAMFLDFNYCPA